MDRWPSCISLWRRGGQEAEKDSEPLAADIQSARNPSHDPLGNPCQMPGSKPRARPVLCSTQDTQRKAEGGKPIGDAQGF